MKRLYAVISAVLCLSTAFAGGAGQSTPSKDVLVETFANVKGDFENPSPIDVSLFDNPGNWQFKDAYAADGCLMIKKGGSITLPSMPELADNASFSFSVRDWEEGEGFEYEINPPSLSITNGQLSTDKYDFYSSMGAYYIYDASPETRLTLTASNPIILERIQVFYSGYTTMGGDTEYGYTGYSHESGEYYAPFDLSLTRYDKQLCFGDDGSHNILVYTLDDTEPTRNSTRYTGPIHISNNVTVRSATIAGNGGLVLDNPRVYTLAVAADPDKPAATFTIAMEKAGTLKSRALDIDADDIEGLIISGVINGEDLAYLASGTGRLGQLKYLDLADVTFEYDNTVYHTSVAAPPGGMGTTYIYNYHFSDEEKEPEYHGTGRPGTEIYEIYSSNLACAFVELLKLETIILPKCLNSIGSGCCNNDALQKVVLPDGITAIGSDAIGRNVSNINLPSTITKIGANGMGGCGIMGVIDLPNLTELGAGAFAGSKISGFVFHKNLTKIGNRAFAGSMIETVDMPSPTDSIPDEMFDGCEKLKTVVIGDGVRYIGSKAFYQTVSYGKCTLESITIPESVEEIGTNAFPDPIVARYPFEDGIRYIGKVAYSAQDNISSVSIKDGTVSLANSLFSFNTNLTSITLPESVRIIGADAFYGAGLSATPDMPGVERIGERAFQYCPNLSRVTLPESLKYVGANAFYGSDGIWRLDYNAIDCTSEWGFGFKNLEKVNIGDKVKRLPSGIFTENKNFKEVELPASLEIIEDNAFANCKALQKVVIPGNLSVLGASAFYGCGLLTDVEIAGVEKIGDVAFSDCASLESIVLPDNTRSIGADAFYNTPIRDIHWPTSLEEIGRSAFSETDLEEVILPEGLKTVGYGVFYPCKKVKTLYIPSTLRFDPDSEYEENAFCMMNDGAGCVVTCMMPQPPMEVKYWYWNYNNRVAQIRVPADLLDTYRNDAEWSKLAHLIVPIDDNAVDEIGTASTSEIKEWYDLSGAKVSNPSANGLYIIRRADGTTSKIMVK